MNNIIDMQSVLNTNYFETVPEYEISLRIALELARRGYVADFTGFKTKVSLNDTSYKYLKNYLMEDSLVLGFSKEENVDYFDGTDVIADFSMYSLDGKPLFEDNGNYLVWNSEWASNCYGDIYARNKLYHLIADFIINLSVRHLVDVILGLETREVSFELDFEYTKNFRIFFRLLSFIRSSSLGSYIKLDIPKEDDANLNYLIFNYECEVANKKKDYTLEEKMNNLRKEGVSEGMVMVLFERSRFNKSNTSGRIENATLIRINEIVSDTIYFSKVRALRTREESKRDFEEIPIENRPAYYDILIPQDSIIEEGTLLIRECGFGTYFNTEKYLICPISTTEMCTKLVSDGDRVFEKELNEAEAIYYTLRQNDAAIDFEKYRDFYFKGEKGYYDTLDHSVLDFTLESATNSFDLSAEVPEVQLYERKLYEKQTTKKDIDGELCDMDDYQLSDEDLLAESETD